MEQTCSTVRNRKGKADFKEQICMEAIKYSTLTNTFEQAKELCKNVPSRFIVSVFCTGLIVGYFISYGTRTLETKVIRNMTGTNPVDAFVLSELDKGDELFFRGEIKESLKQFSGILTAHAQSPRALFGFGRALNMLGEQSKHKEYLIDAKLALFDAISAPEVPRDILIKSLTRLTQLYIATEPAASLDRLWEFLSTHFNHTLEPRHLFIQQLSEHKMTEKRAEHWLIEMIESNKEDCISMALLGQLYEKQNYFEKASFFLQNAIDLDCDGVRNGVFYKYLNEAYLRLEQYDQR